MKTILGTLMRLAIVTVAPAAIGMSAWSTASLAEPAENVAPAVTVARATTSDIALRTMVAGTIVPRDLVEVNPQINGAAILDIHVEAGDTVAKGAVLARLDDTLFKAQKVKALAGIERARASIAEARSQIDSAQAADDANKAAQARAKALFASGTISKAALDQANSAAAQSAAALLSARDALVAAQAELEDSTADLGLAELNVARATITADVAGLVLERNATLGALSVVGAAPLFRIVPDGAFEAEVPIYQTAFHAVAVGDSADLVLPAVGRVSGEVRRKDAAIDATSRTGRVRISLDTGDAVRAGMSISGAITSQSRRELTVPLSAVQSDETGEYVQVVTDGRISRRTVTSSGQTGGKITIIDGLSEGETILARAGAFFRDGDVVRPVEAGDETARVAQATEGLAQ